MTGSLKRVSHIASAALAVLLILFFLNAARSGSFESIDTFQTFVKSYGVFAPVIFTLVQAAQVVIPIIPGFVGCAAGAALFGAWAGFAYNYIGICAGSIIAFFLARKYGVRLVRPLIGEKNYNKYFSMLGGKKFLVFFALCILLPLAPDDALCYLAGLSGMKRNVFVRIILLGKPWLILAYSFGVHGLLHL